MHVLLSAKFVSLFYHGESALTTDIDKTDSFSDRKDVDKMKRDCYHQVAEQINRQEEISWTSLRC